MTADENLNAIEELRQILGDVDDIVAAKILALQPTAKELETAVLWAEGNQDIVSTQGGSLSGKTGQIFEILIAEQPEDEPPAAA